MPPTGESPELLPRGLVLAWLREKTRKGSMEPANKTASRLMLPGITEAGVSIFGQGCTIP